MMRNYYDENHNYEKLKKQHQIQSLKLFNLPPLPPPGHLEAYFVQAPNIYTW